MTRLAALSRRQALALAGLLLLLIGYGMTLMPTQARFAQAPAQSDAALYRAIDARMATGEGYYPAAVAEHRARRYPLRPFVALRMPTLAWVRQAAGPTGSLLLLAALAGALMAAMVVRLRGMLPSRPLWIAAVLLVTLSVVPLVQPAMTMWHEVWAGLLVALALACRSERRWWPSVLLGLAAVLIRELAMPLLVVMAAAALCERRKVEAAAWIGATIVVMLALAAHATALGALLQPGDLRSPGWATAGGWRFILSLAQGATLFRLLPFAGVALLVPLALLGWATARGGFAMRVAGTLLLWVAAFLLIGRPDNFYWGLLLAPLLPSGVALAAPALRDLSRASLRRRAEKAQALGPV